jgi:hypothetical protein
MQPATAPLIKQPFLPQETGRGQANMACVTDLSVTVNRVCLLADRLKPKVATGDQVAAFGRSRV